MNTNEKQQTVIVSLTRRCDGRRDEVPFGSVESAEAYAAKARTIVQPDEFDVLVEV